MSRVMKFLALFLSIFPMIAVVAQETESQEEHKGSMSNGKIEIRYVEIEGDSIYPEYGITEEVLNTYFSQIHTHLGRRLDMEDINRLADAVTLLYREKGLTFNKAYVVPQEIKNATLRLHIQEGILAEVDVFGNELYSTEQIQAALSAYLGKIIYEPDLRKAVSRLNNKPGLKTFSFFSLGSQPGESRLNIRVLEENHHSSLLTIDSHGVEQTGEYRASLRHTINNPFQLSDTLTLSAMTSNEQNNLFGGLSYRMQASENIHIGASVSSNQFTVGGQFANLGLEGELFDLSLFLQESLAGSQNQEHFLSHRLSHKQSEVNSEVFSEILSNEVDYATYELSYSYLYKSKTGQCIENLGVAPSLGLVDHEINTRLESSFLLVRPYYQIALFDVFSSEELPSLLKLDIAGQWSNDMLPASEQFISTGPTANRGFEPGLVSGETGAKLSLELNFETNDLWVPVLGENSLSPFIFYDLSYSKADATGNSATFHSLGLGFNYSKTLSDLSWLEDMAETIRPEGMEASFSIGFPLDYELPDESEQNTTLYGRLSLSF